MAPYSCSLFKVSKTFERSKIFIVFALISVMTEAVRPEVYTGPLTREELDHIAHRIIACHNIPALGVSIVYQNPDLKPSRLPSKSFSNNSIYFWETYRNTSDTSDEIRKEARDDLDAMFCVGSLTKHVSATLIVHLLEQLKHKGQIYSLDTLVTDIIPAVEFAHSQLANVTVEDILSHYTGLAEYFGPFLVGYPTETSRLDLAKITAQLPRTTPNRKSYIYNNHVFSLSGLIAETLGQFVYGEYRTWEALVSDLLREAGISKEEFGFADTVEDGKVENGFFSVNGELRAMNPEVRQLIAPAGAAGSLCITPHAMAKWMKFLVQRGNGRSVSRATIEDPWKKRNSQPTTVLDSMDTPDGHVTNARCGYGLGWGCKTYRGHNHVAHGGGFYAMLSLLRVFPEQNISVFTSTSGPGTHNVAVTMRKLQLYIFDRLMGYSTNSSDFLRSPTLSTEAPVIRNLSDNSGSSTILKQYIGAYHHEVFGEVKVVQKNQEVHLVAGRFGDPILVNCKVHPDSAVMCLMEFTGVLWWISGSDAFRNDKQTDRTVVFRLVRDDGHETRTLTLPLYSSAAPPVFTRRKSNINEVTSSNIVTSVRNGSGKNSIGNVGLMTTLIVYLSYQLKILSISLFLSLVVLF